MCARNIAIVVGASGSLGSAIAESLSASWRVIRLSRSRLIHAESYLCDITDSQSIARARASVRNVIGESSGHIGLVIASGITKSSLLVRQPIEEIQDVVNTNVTGVLAVTKAFLPELLRAQSSSVVFISSIVGEDGNRGQITYAASKASLAGITRAMALEYSSRSMSVNSVAPGYIDAGMAKGIRAPSIPVKRLGHPEDVSHAVSFLLDPRSNYITGQVLRVDGGLRLQ